MKWIKACITTVSYQVLVNGKRTNLIMPSRGIRQGGPLSPYLFILMSDVLSWRMEQRVTNKEIVGIKAKRTCPESHHLLFADDSLFFLKGSLDNAQALKYTLDKYCTTSGQRVNLSKSSIFCAVIQENTFTREVANVFGMNLVRDQGKYLGLPSMWGKIQVCSPKILGKEDCK